MNLTEDQKTAVEKGYLKNQKVALKPSPRSNKMGISDPSHMAYFQIDQGATFFCLPRNSRGDIVNVFKDEAERAFFEEKLGLELNSSKPRNFFETFNIKIIKDSSLMYKGESFDMLDPMDNLRVRVLLANPSVAPDWESRKLKMEYRWAIVDEGEENKAAEEEYDSKIEFGMAMAKFQTVADMRSVLRIYYGTIGSNKTVPVDASRQMMMKDLNGIADDVKKRDKFLEVIEDSLFDMKKLIIRSLELKLIIKNGDNSYIFTGDDKTYTFDEIAKALLEFKESDNDIYYKLKAQIENVK